MASAAGPAPQTFRQSDSHLVFPVWRTIRELQHSDGGVADLDSIAAHLLLLHGCTPLDRSRVSTALDHMTADGLLLMDGDDSETATYRLPVRSPANSRSGSVVTTMTDSDAADDTGDDDADHNGTDDGKQSLRGMRLLTTCRVSRTRDPYCYECHRAGEVLPCAECPRTFHTRCVRPADQLDVPLLPLRDPVPDVVEKTFQLTFDQPYARVRAQQSKPGHRAAAAAGDPQSLRLCLRCRMLKRNAQHLRPLTPLDQLNEMVRFSFERIRSWIARDTFSTQEPKSLHIPSAYVRLLLPVLMHRPRTVVDILARIAATGYRSLIDYMIDVLDVVHCIGVLRGTACPDYEAAKYLQLDAMHDITEMTRCQDCYRHSIRQRSDAQWFVRPCTRPHQLVHAKMTGFSYWPAKVIRQVRRTDGSVQFDVRFFGGDHARALIAERSVVPDGRPVQLKKTVGLRKAQDEMAAHKACLERVAAGGVMDEDDQLVASASNAATKASEVSSKEVKRKRGRPSSRSTTMVPPPTTSKSVPKVASSVSKRASSAAKSLGTANKRAKRSHTPANQTNGTAASNNNDNTVISTGHNNGNSTAKTVDVDDVTLENTVEPVHIAGDDEPTSVNMAYESCQDASTLVQRSDTVASSSTSDVAIVAEAEEEEVVESEEDDVGWGLDEPETSTPLSSKKGNGVAVRLSFHNETSLSETQPPLLDAEEPTTSAAVTIEQLRRNMENCPPMFVYTAVCALRDQIAINEQQRKRYEEQLALAKRMQWCTVCLNQAIYYCCWRVSYCSPECQHTDWKQGHEGKCKRQKNSGNLLQR